jgi:Protein of unknown function (DUF3099)
MSQADEVPPAGPPLSAAPPGDSVVEANEGVPVADPQRGVEPVLITDAARSYEEELATRKRRYKIMMGMRIPFMVLAAVFYQIPWLAVTLLVLSIPLPWIAVLIANDRLPIKAEAVNRYEAERRQIEAREHPVIEG